MSFMLLNQQTMSRATNSTVNFASLRTPSCANIAKPVTNAVRARCAGFTNNPEFWATKFRKRKIESANLL